MTSSAAPMVRLSHLDQLWFQVAGTLCNLTCRHCFISCSPKNDTFGYLPFDTVRRCLAESVALGVKEYYFTGGEPFLHREMTSILIETLRYGPATVLTNGTVFKDEWLEALARAEAQGLYSLEFRVSIDGFSPESNDPIRGAGTFERAMRGVRQLVRHGFLPIITAARTWPDEQEPEVVEKFSQALRAIGYCRPRLKILPALLIGAEERRTRGYDESERVQVEMMDGYDASQLICEHSRIVTDRGVYVCPILIESPEARLGDKLTDALVPYPIKHGACSTCYRYGAICANPSSGARQ
ncbi:MAG TPA: radical SAM protein [Pirellulales bacterium]|nr:radical SAM protein [Pirellulales bacterium]